MSDINREFERAVTGRSGEGLSFMGWVALVFGGLFTLGLVGAAFAAFYIRDHVVPEIHREMAHAAGSEQARALAEVMLARLEGQTRILAMDPEQGLAFLEDSRVEALPQAMFDLAQEGDGGSLTLHSDEGEVRLNLIRTDGGGSLTIDSPDGQVRMDLVGTPDGGFLSIDSQDGQVRSHLVKGEDGGQFVIRSHEGTVRFGAGEQAEALPGWVPMAEDMPSAPQGVYSISSPEGALGAVSWQSDRSALDVLDACKGRLEAMGFDLRIRTRVQSEGPGQEQASLWARHEESGRLVFLVAHHEDGVTKVLLGYGEELR
jgi:hypothetical protein